MADADGQTVEQEVFDNDNNEGKNLARKVSGSDQKACPRVNCLEKIVICLDVSQEMDTVSFRSRAGDKFPPMKLVKRALGMFVHTKHKLDSRHQFALAILHETAQWILDFTYNPNDVVKALDELGDTQQTDTCDLASLFEKVNEKIKLPEVNDFTVDPPPYTVRTILIYGRSHCLPELVSSEAVERLQASPHFFMDVYYVHEHPNERNMCEAVFDRLCDLDINSLYYVYEVSRNPTKVYDSMSQLLAHPLQRPRQKDTVYTIEIPPVAQEARG